MPNTQDRDIQRPRQLPVWTWMLGAAATATGLLTLVYYLFERYFADENSTTFEIARTTATLVGILGAALLAAIAVRRQISNEASHDLELNRRNDELKRHQAQQDRLDQDTDRAIVSALRDRYTTAAEQLGHDTPAIRLAGVYAMSALADDWADRSNKTETQTCIEVLCSMLRSPTPDSQDEQHRAADREIRQSIVRVIATRLRPTAETSWTGMDFDFTGATFNGIYDFSEVQFTGGKVSFNEAQFTGGKVSFFRVQWTGGHVSFARAKFADGTVTFDQARLTAGHVTFNWAEFTGGHVTFDWAEFTGGTLGFSLTRFNGGKVSFDEATFDGASVAFVRAKFHSGQVTFTQAKFSGGHVSFNTSEFLGDYVSFAQSDFIDGEVSFARATFSDGYVTFARAKFEGGTVSFATSHFMSGQVSFNWAVFTGGTVLFDAFQRDDVLTGTWIGHPPPGWLLDTPAAD